jgi:6-phosphogluconolactonase
MATDRAEQFLVYAGTYTAKGSEGIYLYRFDASCGAMEVVGLAAAMPNPTFLAIHANRRLLYAVSEVRDKSGRQGGSVNAFAIAPGTGQLTFLNRQSSQGAGPCHLSADATGRFVFVANYVSGSAAILPIEADGRVGEATDVVQHHGSSVDPTRQEGPHVHSITLSPDNRFTLVADLGLDRIIVYRLDPSAGRLLPNDPPWVALKPGAGPRHVAFHPSRPIVYAINELDNTMVAFAWDAEHGALREMQTISTLPADYIGVSYAADVHVDNSGRFLYGSNRGHDSIAIFRIDESSGALATIVQQPVHGKWPRNFAIEPNGGWLLAANQESDSIAVFRIDSATGRLTLQGGTCKVSMPVCLKMLAVSHCETVRRIQS